MVFKCTVLILAELYLKYGACAYAMWTWALSANTGFDNYPKQYDCFGKGNGPYDPNYPTYHVLDYTRGRRSFIDLDMDRPPVPYDYFAIVLPLFAVNDTGTLLHYKAFDLSTPNAIVEIKISMNSGIITTVFTFNYNGSPILQSVQHPDPVPLNQWSMMDIARNPNGGIRFRNYADLPDSYGYHITFPLKGSAHIGTSFGNGRGEFLGRFGCFQVRNTFTAPPMYNVWVSCYGFVPEVPSRECFGVQAKFVWPLNKQSLGYEAMTNRQQGKSPKSFNWVFDDSIGGLLISTASVFDTCTYLQLQAPFDELMYKRYSIAMFLKPDNSNGVTLMRVEQPPGGCFNEMDVAIVQSRIRVTLSLNQNTVETSLLINPVDAWHFLAVQFNCDWKELSMIVDNQYNSTAFTFSIQGSQMSVQYLKMYVGTFPSVKGFSGRISCLTMFNTPLDEVDAENRLRDECNTHAASFFAPVDEDPSPIILWPLDVNSYGYEVLTNSNIGSSPAHQCWRFNDQVGDTINSGAVIFYGAANFTVVLPITSLNTDEFAVGIFMNPEVNTNGTIMEAGLATSNNNYTVKLTINFGQLTVHVISGLTCLTKSVDIAQDDWSSVIVQTNPAGYQFIVNSVKHAVVVGCTVSVATSTNIIRLGRGAAGAVDDDFHGMLRCLSIFDVSIYGGRGEDILLNGCNSSIVHNFKPNTGGERASELWRLDESDGLSEKGLSDMELLTSNSSLSFDGSSLLHVLINMTISQQPDIAVGFFIRPSKYNTGNVLTAEDENSTLVFTITMDTTSLSIHFYTSGDSQCSSVQFTGVEPDTWHHVFIQRIASCQLVMIMVDEEKQNSSAECLPSEQLSMLRVRLGGAQRSLNNFRGQLSCLLLFYTPLQDENIRDLMASSCNNGTTGDLEVDDEYELSNLTSTQYRLIQAESAPNPLYFDLLRNVRVRSVSHCGRMCTSNQFCRSFTVDKTNIQTSCSLYSFLTTSQGLIPMDGIGYYGILYKEAADKI